MIIYIYIYIYDQDVTPDVNEDEKWSVRYDNEWFLKAFMQKWLNSHWNEGDYEIVQVWDDKVERRLLIIVWYNLYQIDTYSFW